MASKTLQVAVTYPAGTVVSVYQGSMPDSTITGGFPGVPVATVTVSSAGTVTISNLEPGGNYVLVAEVAGVWRYIEFSVPQSSSGSSGVGGGSPLITDAGTLGSTESLSLGLTEQWLVGILNADVTVTLSDVEDGSRFRLFLTQDGVGGRTLTINDGVSSQAVNINSAAGESTLVEGWYDGTDLFVNVEAPSGQPFGVNVKDYGAVGDGTTDDTAAIQAAIDAIKGTNGANPRGGTIFFPKGTYLCSGSVNLADTVSITLLGEGMPSSGQNHQPSSRLKYTGTGARFLDCRSADGLRLSGLGILYSSSSFTGNLVDFAHSGTGSDSVSCLVENCLLYPSGTGYGSAHCLISFENAIISTVRFCKLGGAQWAILGRDSAGAGYSNSINVYDSAFDNCVQAFIGNVGERWQIRGNTFEMLSNLGIAGVTPWIYKSDISGAATLGGSLNFSDNWCGDFSASSQGYLYLDYREGWDGFVCTGNTMPGGTAPSMRLYGVVRGALIAGNVLSIADPAVSPIDLGGPATSGTVGVKAGIVVMANYFNGIGSTTEPVKYLDHWYRSVMIGNVGYNSAVRDILHFGGHLVLGANDPTNLGPTITVGGGAGTGATASLIGNDTTGTITLNTGTGTSAADIFYLDWLNDYTSSLAPSADPDYKPKIFLTPVNSAAANAKPVQRDDVGGELTNLRVDVFTALAGSTTYKWHYLVIQ